MGELIIEITIWITFIVIAWVVVPKLDRIIDLLEKDNEPK